MIPDQRVRLINGDILPLEVSGMDATVIQARSADMGALDIPRSAVDSIQLGIVPQKVVYSGPEDFQGWIRDDSGSRNWTVTDNEFFAEGQGTVSRKPDLPEKFIVSFDLHWSHHPNFRFSFADPLLPGDQRSDRYFLEFNGAGVNVKRESTTGARYTALVLLSRSPEQFPDQKISVEIRVDRSRGLVQLYLNGHFEGRYSDPVPNIPSGSGISLYSQAPRESEQKVSRIRVKEWDDRGDRHRSEERGNGKQDSLIGRYGERFGGMLSGIREGAEGSVYLFKSDFQEEIIELPESEVSTLFFAGNTQQANSETAYGLILRLRGKGEIRVSSCIFSGKTVKVVHPLLGSMVLDRDGITSMERREIPKAKAIESP